MNGLMDKVVEAKIQSGVRRCASRFGDAERAGGGLGL
jgi:hypothetical protein